MPGLRRQGLQMSKTRASALKLSFVNTGFLFDNLTMKRNRSVIAALSVTMVLFGAGQVLGDEPRSIQAVAESAQQSTANVAEAALRKSVTVGPARQDGGPLSAQGIAGGYVFVPINPYRSYDSRYFTEGFLIGGDEEYLNVLTDEYGRQMIPSDAVAVTYNLTATGNVGDGGYLALYPGDIYWPGNSSINFGPNSTIANGGVVAVDAAGGIWVRLGSGYVATNYILDITGYYK